MSVIPSSFIEHNTQESLRVRAEITRLLSNLSSGVITFDEFLDLLQGNVFKSVRSKKVFELMSTLQGWTQETALSALIAYGVPPKTALYNLLANEAHRKIVSHLISTGAGQWQRRVRAPQGYPWFGNVLDAIDQIDREDLPLEYRRTARFVDADQAPGVPKYQGEDKLDSLFDDDVDDSLNDYDPIEEDNDSSDSFIDQLVAGQFDDGNDDDETSVDDDLDSLFGN